MAALADLCSGIIVYRVMHTVPLSTARVRKLRERRSLGAAMVAPIGILYFDAGQSPAFEV